MQKDVKELIEWLDARKNENYETYLYYPQITMLLNYIKELETMVDAQRDINENLMRKWIKRGAIISKAKKHLEEKVEDEWSLVDTSVAWETIDILEGKYEK